MPIAKDRRLGEFEGNACWQLDADKWVLNNILYSNTTQV